MRMKIAVMALAAVIVGVFAFTRTKNAPPFDLRDAVGDSEFNTDIPAFKKGDNSNIPAPLPPIKITPKTGSADWEEFYPGEMWQKSLDGGTQEETLLIAYGGYRADEPGVKNWAEALAGAGGFKYIVAVKGPAIVDYSDHKKKKANELLVEMLLTANVSKIIISAHSSGAYVAHELLAMLKGNSVLPSKTIYYDLDGATCVICKDLALASPDFKFTCVGARQGELKSPNYGSVAACGAKHFMPLEFNAGCAGAWCMHACLINTNAAAINPDRPSVPLYYADPLIHVATGYLFSDR